MLATTPRRPFHTLRHLFPDVPPLGLQILSSVLKAEGHTVQIEDVQHLKPLHRQFVSAIHNFRPDVIGFTNNCMANTPAIMKVAEYIKENYPHIHLIAGGQFPTFAPQFFLERKSNVFDAVGLFEGEKIIGPLVNVLVNDLPLSTVQGIAYMEKNGAIVRNPPPEIFQSSDDHPIPDWEANLRKASFSNGFAASIETSRGCLYECSFCTIPRYFGKPQYKSVDRIMQEMKLLKKLGVTEFFIVDDSFGTNATIVKELFRRMIDENLDLRFSIQIRADIIVQHPDLIEMGAKAGLYLSVVGFEGYSTSVIRETKKKTSITINRNASKILRQNGVAVFGTHIIGGRNTNILDYLLTFIFGRHYSDVFRMTIYTPLFGSALFRRLAKENKIRSLNPNDYYFGTYVIKDNHHPILIKLVYFGLQLLHYILPGTIYKTLFSPNPIIRKFNCRAYRGATEFVLGTITEKIKPGLKTWK